MSAFQRVEIPFVGGFNASRSRPISSQRTINLYPEVTPDGKQQAALLSWPGNLLWKQGAQGVSCRGMYVWDGYLYKVTGTSLYQYDDVKTETLIGTIPGTGRCEFASDPGRLVIVTDGSVYEYDGTTLSDITDASLDTPIAAAFLNARYIFNGDNGAWDYSEVDDPSTIAGSYTAESAGDDLVRVYAFNQVLYLFGEKTIEPWQDTGISADPFVRVDGGIIQKGCAAGHSVTNTDSYVYFLGDDRQVYRISGYQVQPISNTGIAHFLESAVTVSDCIAWPVSLEGQDFVIFQFQSENKTYAYSENSATWFELSNGVLGNRHRINSYAYFAGAHLIGDIDSGSIFAMDSDTFNDNGDEYVRQRDSMTLSGAMIGKPGQTMRMRRLELICETGVGNDSVTNPQIAFSCSYDGGASFTNERWLNLGEDGQRRTRVEWFNMAVFRELIVRIRMTDDAFLAITGMSIDVEEAGW